jgi:hypothetical protein
MFVASSARPALVAEEAGVVVLLDFIEGDMLQLTMNCSVVDV